MGPDRLHRGATEPRSSRRARWRFPALAGLVLLALLGAVAWLARAPAVGVTARAPTSSSSSRSLVELAPLRELATSRELPTSQRLEFSAPVSAGFSDSTRLHLRALAADGSVVTPSCFEIFTVDRIDTSNPLVRESQIVNATGAVTTVDLSPSVFAVRVTASASGHTAGSLNLDNLRHVDGRPRLSGLVEHSIDVRLDQAVAAPCLVGRITVDGVARVPQDLELLLREASDDQIVQCEVRIDRSASSYSIGPLIGGPLRLFVAGRDVAPRSIDVPNVGSRDAASLDLDLTSGRTALLEVRTAETGDPASGVELRVDVTIDAWRRADAVGVAGRPYLARTDARGRLEIRGLPERGHLTVSQCVPPRRTSYGYAFEPGAPCFEHRLTSADPTILRANVEISTATPPTCTIWGRLADSRVECGAQHLRLCVARATADTVTVTRYAFGESALWELEIEPAERAQLWLECSDARASDIVAITPSARARLGPIVFPARVPTPITLAWSGAAPGDRMYVVRLGGLVDEPTCALELEAESGVHVIELEARCELGIALERGGTRLQRIVRCDPRHEREIRVAWPAPESVEVRLASDGDSIPEHACVVLHPLDNAQALEVRLQLEHGRATVHSLAPGAYFFRVEGFDAAALVVGVARRERNALEFVLNWRACDIESAESLVELDSIDGVDLASVPRVMRRLVADASETAGSDGSRPRRIRLPCGSKWSPVCRSAPQTDQKVDKQ